VVLFSKGSQTTFGKNLAAFTTELARPIAVSPNEICGVGLYEFVCPPPQVGTIRNVELVGITAAII
jgi:hypothetical protein